MPRMFGFLMRQHQKQFDEIVRLPREAEALEMLLLQLAIPIFRCHSEVLLRCSEVSEALVERTPPLGIQFHRKDCVVERPRPLVMQFQLQPGTALTME
jgi:hypothetical protein